MHFSCISPCKLNLFLYITGRRPDNYHNLQTLFVILDKGDKMSFNLSDTDADSTDYASLIDIKGPFDFAKEKNLIFKAALAFYKKYDIRRPLCIEVEKFIPEGAGLGGGSSNAATTLLVLNAMCRIHATEDDLIDLGRQLGADVPVFIHGHAAFAQGTGDILHTVDIDEKYYLVVTPKCHVNTSEVFKNKDLKRDWPVRDFKTLISLGYYNEFTKSVANIHSLVGQCLISLVKYGPAHMSGSGSSCFVEFDTLEDAQRALDDLDTSLYRSAFVAKSCNTSCTTLSICHNF
ncbi:4-diphosphocytidyl-2-C-methyl-D-erythritol kinase [Anaerobiospirillum thomasii]|uniref:4-diphosphocytidyl-2-C-methyl-D-erythritol kinase n=1 Tax=Anaerobiospirillum thomasii TaxID=179995 RepID=A0A2X0WD57_9GAMM|nr:4-(cytidine 5'-diphospho)-2-C-methyl-D-erythritol kinase [Anaerobiospirillum thomasii]SPT68227.1 4-diphosphocytidyl-2-C-methyl-D-erythritol kinase [Anaerobiospirillum thomasii]SPT70703.1 4-diphosphocytidyl-2-C-methyl-D-erythritol kinase [Anaerobiospirillum thomasii]